MLGPEVKHSGEPSNYQFAERWMDVEVILASIIGGYKLAEMHFIEHRFVRLAEKSEVDGKAGDDEDK